MGGPPRKFGRIIKRMRSALAIIFLASLAAANPSPPIPPRPKNSSTKQRTGAKTHQRAGRAAWVQVELHHRLYRNSSAPANERRSPPPSSSRKEHIASTSSNPRRHGRQMKLLKLSSRWPPRPTTREREEPQARRVARGHIRLKANMSAGDRIKPSASSRGDLLKMTTNSRDQNKLLDVWTGCAPSRRP